MPSNNTPRHGDPIVDSNGVATRQFQAYIDDLSDVGKAVQVSKYTVATVPDATKYEGYLIYVTDDAVSGKVIAFSDGTSWLKVDTLTAIS